MWKFYVIRILLTKRKCFRLNANSKWERTTATTSTTTRTTKTTTFISVLCLFTLKRHTFRIEFCHAKVDVFAFQHLLEASLSISIVKHHIYSVWSGMMRKLGVEVGVCSFHLHNLQNLSEVLLTPTTLRNYRCSIVNMCGEGIPWIIRLHFFFRAVISSSHRVNCNSK